MKSFIKTWSKVLSPIQQFRAVIFVYMILIVLSVGCSSTKPKLEFGELWLPIHQYGADTTNVGLAVTSLNTHNVSDFRVLGPDGKEAGETQVVHTQFEIPASKQSEFDGAELVIIHHLRVEGLNSKTNYTLAVLNHNGSVMDQRVFQTMTPSTNHKAIFGSCIKDSYSARARPIWHSINKEGADFLLLLGDNIYSSPEAHPKMSESDRLIYRHTLTRFNTDLFYWKNLKPVYTIWDDNDYGMRDGDKTYKSKSHSRQIYLGFFPQFSGNNSKNWGYSMGSSLRLGKVTYLLLDNRTHRTPNGKFGDVAAHLGEYQLTKIKKELSKEGRFVWIASGGQFFGGYHKYESYERNHPVEFKKFRSILKNSRSRFALLAGDRHQTLVLLNRADVGQETIEFVSSPIQGKVYPGSQKDETNPRMILGNDNSFNYGVLDMKLKKGTLHIDVAAKNKKGKTLFIREFLFGL